MRQHDALIVIAIYEWVMCAMLLLMACVVLPIALLLTPFDADSWGEFFIRFFIVGLALAASFGIGIASGIVGFGLLHRREWARVGAIVLAIIGLIGFPIWTIIGVLILIYLFSAEARAAFGHENGRMTPITNESVFDTGVVPPPPDDIAPD